MRIIYFDLCAIPLFLMILYICYARKMTRGSANQLFIFLVSLSLVSTLADLGMETLDNMVPLSEAGRLTVSILAYVYLSMRNASTVVMLLFLLALTRTIFLIKRSWIRFVFFAPYVCLLILLAQNPLTHTVFTVSKETGYARGPLILIIYIIALTYGFTGLFYSIYCRRYLPDNKWLSLLYIYLLTHLAVIIQFFHPGILVEMFFTAMGEVMIMLSVMRPEERMDSEMGMLSWNSYQTDIRNIVRSGERVQIMVIRMQNSKEIQNYLGDHIPLKMIKLDKSMLDEASCGNGRLILEHTVRMMQSIGKKLVAEGAETTDVVELLKDMNCDYIQGFYFSKPLCEDHFIFFLEEQNNRKIS